MIGKAVDGVDNLAPHKFPIHLRECLQKNHKNCLISQTHQKGPLPPTKSLWNRMTRWVFNLGTKLLESVTRQPDFQRTYLFLCRNLKEKRNGMVVMLELAL